MWDFEESGRGLVWDRTLAEGGWFGATFDRHDLEMHLKGSWDSLTIFFPSPMILALLSLRVGGVFCSKSSSPLLDSLDIIHTRVPFFLIHHGLTHSILAEESSSLLNTLHVTFTTNKFTHDKVSGFSSISMRHVRFTLKITATLCSVIPSMRNFSLSTRTSHSPLVHLILKRILAKKQPPHPCTPPNNCNLRASIHALNSIISQWSQWVVNILNFKLISIILYSTAPETVGRGRQWCKNLYAIFEISCA